MNNEEIFNNSAKEVVKKEIKFLVDEAPCNKLNKGEAFDVYTTSNVRVRKCFRENIYTLKGRTGDTLQEIYDKIFAEYFKNNPL